MTGRLREELHRIGDEAPVADVSSDTWGRARRARTRDRVLAGAAAVAVLALVGGMAGLLPDRSSTPVASARGAVPNHVYAVTSTRDVPVTSDLAIGRTAAAYVTTIGATAHVVTIGAVDGRYHVLDLPRFAERGGLEYVASAPVALSPDGTQIAYAYSGEVPDHGPVPTGLTIVDLRSGASRSVPVTGGQGILVRTVAWSPDGRWLVWSGQVSTRWNDRERRFGEEMAAGRIAPGADSSQPVPVSNQAVQAVGVGSSGRVAITSPRQAVIWDGGVVDRSRLPHGSGSPLDLVHVGSSVADVRAGTSGRSTVFHVLRWSTDGVTVSDPRTSDVTMAVRGWMGDTPVVEAQPTSRGWSTTLLSVLTDSGLHEIGRLDLGVQDLTLATDLMPASQPTADLPAPDWAPHDGAPWPWIGLGAGVLALLAVGVVVVVRRRRPPR